MKIFFIEKDEAKNEAFNETQSYFFEVNLNNTQDFYSSQNKDNANLPEQIYAI